MKTRPRSPQPRTLHTRLLTLATGTLFAALPLTVLAAAGDLDTTFDGDSKVSTAIGSVVVQAPTHVIGLFPGGRFGRDLEYLRMPLFEEQKIRPEDGSCVASNIRLAKSEEGIKGEGRETPIRVAQTGDDKGAPAKGEKAAPGARMGSRCPDECSNECCKNCKGCICCSNPDMRAPLDNASRIKGGYKPLPNPKRHADPE